MAQKELPKEAERNLDVADTLNGWDFDWIAILNGTQASYSNWSQGGVNTISGSASSVFGAQYRKDHYAYALVTNLKYGKAKLEGQGTRKTNDQVVVKNRWSYLFNDDRFSAFGNINLQTQFDKGYDYNNDDELISRFFAPAYLRQYGGIAFSPVPYFGMEAGMGFKETVVRDTSLSTLYGVDEGEKFRFEPGFSLNMTFNKEILENVSLSSSVETFMNPQNSIEYTDVTFSNELVGKINSYLQTTIQFDLVYDRDYSSEVQMRQVLALGFSYTIF